MTAAASAVMLSDQPAALRLVQLAWLAAAVFVVSAVYGALLPLLPGWLSSTMPDASAVEITRKASAKLTLLSGTGRQEVKLKPVGDELEAKGSFKVAADTKVVAMVSLAGKSSTARFVLKQPLR